LHSRQLQKLRSQVAEKGLTIIPLKLYFKNSWAKLEIGLVKGKKHFDKKERIKQRDIKRDTEREMEKF
jgi:SsrA-binding protein